MSKAQILSMQRLTGLTGLTALVAVALGLQGPLVAAQSLTAGLTTETVVEKQQKQPLPLEQRALVTYDAYILGPAMVADRTSGSSRAEWNVLDWP